MGTIGNISDYNNNIRQKILLSKRCLGYKEKGLALKSNSEIYALCKTEILLDWFVWKYTGRFYTQFTNIKNSKSEVILKNKWNLFLVYFSIYVYSFNYKLFYNLWTWLQTHETFIKQFTLSKYCLCLEFQTENERLIFKASSFSRPVTNWKVFHCR